MIVSVSSARRDTTSGAHKRQSNFTAMLAINLRDASLSVDLVDGEPVQVDSRDRWKRADGRRISRATVNYLGMVLFRSALCTSARSKLTYFPRADICDRWVGDYLETLYKIGSFLNRSDPYGAAALYDDVPRMDANAAELRLQREGSVRFDASRHMLWHPIRHGKLSMLPDLYAAAVRAERKALIRCHR
jgi:hypothetical protein